MTRTAIPLSIIICFCLLLCGFSSGKREADPEIHQVLWSRADSSYNNFRIPAIIVTKERTVLAFAEGREAGDAGNIDILLKRSEDGGRTWSGQTVVWDNGHNSCGNPCPVVDRTTGRIILFMTWNLGSDNEDDIIRKMSSDTRRPYLCYSDDDGLTWSEPVDLSGTCKDPDWGWYATGPGVGLQLQSERYRNRLVIPANNSYTVQNKKDAVREGYGYGSHVVYSDDGGSSWSMSEAITPGCNESQLVELSNGDLMMNMRSYNKKGCRAISVSQDGGASWSAITHDPQLVESVCQASFIRYGSYQGREGYLFSNPAVTSGRTHMTIKASLDECQTWSSEIVVHEGPAAYSCMTVLPDGNIGLLFEAGEKAPNEKMVFVSFQPDELFQ
jgi:sialidase-1